MTTLAESERRLTLVYEHLIKGWSRADMLRSIKNASPEDPWYWASDGATGPQSALDRVIAKANAQFEEDAKHDRAKALGRTLKRREDLYKKSVEHMDLKTALAVDQDTAKLMDLYPVVKTASVTVELNPYAGLPQADLQLILDDLQAKLSALSPKPSTLSLPDLEVEQAEFVELDSE